MNDSSKTTIPKNYFVDPGIKILNGSLIEDYSFIDAGDELCPRFQVNLNGNRTSITLPINNMQLDFSNASIIKNGADFESFIGYTIQSVMYKREPKPVLLVEMKRDDQLLPAFFFHYNDNKKLDVVRYFMKGNKITLTSSEELFFMDELIENCVTNKFMGVDDNLAQREQITSYLSSYDKGMIEKITYNYKHIPGSNNEKIKEIKRIIYGF